jgi:hypothetical protein
MTRKEKLIQLMNKIDESYGIGLEAITENTDIDEFIKRFIHKFTINYDMSEELNMINENLGKSYVELLNEI